MGRVAMVVGGARSGKSTYAEALVAEHGGDDVVYFATGRPYGRAMLARIKRHMERLPKTWTVVNETDDLLAATHKFPATTRAVLLECLYTWTANRLLALGDEKSPEWRKRVEQLEMDLLDELQAFVEHARNAPWMLVQVSSEVGMGLPPERPRQRVFRDLVGRVNDRAATLSDDTYAVLVGHALNLRELAVTTRGSKASTE